MKIVLVTNDGDGFAGEVDIEDGTTIQRLFSERIPGAEITDHLLRVNRVAADVGQILREGDRVTITPLRIEGACA